MTFQPTDSPTNLILNPPDIGTPVLSQPMLVPNQTSLGTLASQLVASMTSSSDPSVGSNAPVFPLAQEGAAHPSPTSDMSIVTPLSEVEFPLQRDLPRVLPTPGRELGRLAECTQDNWEKLFQYMRQHEKDLGEMNKIIQRHRFHLESKFETHAIHTQEQFTQLTAVVLVTREKLEKELDSMMKAMKRIAVEECDKIRVATAAELTFLVQQLQLELQNDFKNSQSAMENTYTEMMRNTDQLTECITLVKQLSVQVETLRTQVETTAVENKREMRELQRKVTQHDSQTSHTSHTRDMSSLYATSHPASLSAPSVPSSRIDHIKLMKVFPTYGKPGDDPDPLLYLSKCHDFIALHPLSDCDILATFRTVLYGTARDWWEITRSKVATWGEFKSSFLSAFLAEDYQDELAERVRTKKQQEKESIRDFAYSYRALCTRWDAKLTELDIVKLILKNIKPYLASQLRGRVNDVDELVRLGHQLERDHEQQLEYEQTIQKKNNPAHKVSTPVQHVERPPVCWRCKGSHSPGTCPQHTSPASPNGSHRQHQHKQQTQNY